MKTVHDYMYHIRNNAENCVRNLLRDVVKRLGKHELSAVDYLDDGTPVGTSLTDDYLDSNTFTRSASKCPSTSRMDPQRSTLRALVPRYGETSTRLYP